MKFQLNFEIGGDAILSKDHDNLAGEGNDSDLLAMI